MTDIAVDPAHLHKAVSRLEAIATTLERTIREHAEDIRPAPAGSDEVSLAASASFTTSGEHFETEVTKGVRAIRDVASALRDGSSAVSLTDQAIAAEISGV